MLNARADRSAAIRQRGAARELLDRATARRPAQSSLWLNLATALRALDLRDEEEKALQTVLTIEPRNLLALLQKAELLERRGKPKAAAGVYQQRVADIAPNARLPNCVARSGDARNRRRAAQRRGLAAHVDGSAQPARARAI